MKSFWLRIVILLTVLTSSIRAHEDGNDRVLKDLFITESSRACKNSCLDQDLFFCPHESGKSGVCCDSF